MEKIKKTDDEWKAQLEPEAYRVTRLAGTERPFTGRYNAEKRAGVYGCICCGLPLFRSDAKFESGCGWPSFFQPVNSQNIAENTAMTKNSKNLRKDLFTY